MIGDTYAWVDAGATAESTASAVAMMVNLSVRRIFSVLSLWIALGFLIAVGLLAVLGLVSASRLGCGRVSLCFVFGVSIAVTLSGECLGAKGGGIVD